MRATACWSARGTGAPQESDPALLQELIAEEEAAGFLEEVDNLEAAFSPAGERTTWPSARSTLAKLQAELPA